jgi:tetraacyldisaccharide 4'-kinase
VAKRLVQSSRFPDNRNFPLILLHGPAFVFSPSAFREIVSGRRRGLAAGVARAGLRAASIPYGWVVRGRNLRFDRGSLPIHRATVPVVSVGNLTVGGTGKTPMVEWISHYVRQQGVRAAILSRGYGAEQGGLNDEALELELSLPDVPHLQNPDRRASATVAVEELASQLLLLDDGFQHRRLARDLDIVLLDASEPFGFDYVLPRGTLREPVAGLRRAGVIVLSRADMIEPSARETIRRRALELAPHVVWCEVEHRAASLIDSVGGAYPLDQVRGQRVAAFCGIGNPAGFRHTLETLGCQVEAWQEFPDHHGYNRDDVDALEKLVQQSRVDQVLCTRKDLVKLRVPTLGGKPLRAVGVKLVFLRGEAELKSALAPHIERARQANQELLNADA